MTKTLPFVLLLLVFQSCSTSESIFDLGPSQSMSITGKGPGQDAAYNPYGGGNSLAVVTNLGKNSFTVRVEEAGQVTETLLVEVEQVKEVKLMRGAELYLDSERKAKAKVIFKKEKG